MSSSTRSATLLDGTYDEALERLHRTGPEWDGWMSNHGPMAVEALARRGRGDVVLRWTDEYCDRLEDLPRSTRPVTDDDWQEALGDARRLADWISFFRRRLEGAAWEDVLGEWWPRLLPGIAAGATHGVIRTGHAALALRATENEVRVDELAHALGYWAGRWHLVPVVVPAGTSPAADLVASVPRVPRQEGGIRDRLPQLSETPGFAEHLASLRVAGPDEVPAALADLVDAVVLAYPTVAVGNPTMLVHAATAPNAVLRALPSLPRDQWLPSYAAAWTASAAVLSAYLPSDPPRWEGDVADADEAWEVAVAAAGEHQVKLADTALDTWERTGDRRALDAVVRAVSLDA